MFMPPQPMPRCMSDSKRGRPRLIGLIIDLKSKRDQPSSIASSPRLDRRTRDARVCTGIMQALSAHSCQQRCLYPILLRTTPNASSRRVTRSAVSLAVVRPNCGQPSVQRLPRSPRLYRICCRLTMFHSKRCREPSEANMGAENYSRTYLVHMHCYLQYCVDAAMGASVL
jgi:hypothetical protein